MTKRKSLADQVGEQAVTIDGLRNLLSQQKADFAVLQNSYEVEQDNNRGLNELVISLKDSIDGKDLNLAQLHTKVEKLETDLKSKNTSYIYANDRATAAESEIEQAHATLNTIPEAVPAEFEKEYGKGKHSLSARFMGTLVALMRAV
jgi:chromosome segregation ATPase